MRGWLGNVLDSYNLFFCRIAIFRNLVIAYYCLISAYREQEQRQLYLQTRPKGLVKVRVNATDLFDSYPYEMENE